MVVVRKLTVKVTLTEKIEKKRTLPALVVGSTTFYIARRTLSTAVIMAILVAITT
jgi:hypothetical protein